MILFVQRRLINGCFSPFWLSIIAPTDQISERNCVIPSLRWISERGTVPHAGLSLPTSQETHAQLESRFTSCRPREGGDPCLASLPYHTSRSPPSRGRHASNLWVMISMPEIHRKLGMTYRIMAVRLFLYVDLAGNLFYPTPSPQPKHQQRK